MTPTEKARRSDALYYETVSVTRRVLCDAIANREADLEDLREENAMLRESVKRLMTQRDERLAKAETDSAKLREEFNKMDVWHSKELTAAMDENAKLRELVRILYYCGLPWKDCDGCAMNGAEMRIEISDIEFCDGLHDLMRELGVIE